MGDLQPRFQRATAMLGGLPGPVTHLDRLAALAHHEVDRGVPLHASRPPGPGDDVAGGDGLAVRLVDRPSARRRWRLGLRALRGPRSGTVYRSGPWRRSGDRWSACAGRCRRRGRGDHGVLGPPRRMPCRRRLAGRARRGRARLRSSSPASWGTVCSSRGPRYSTTRHRRAAARPAARRGSGHAVGVVGVSAVVGSVVVAAAVVGALAGGCSAVAGSPTGSAAVVPCRVGARQRLGPRHDDGRGAHRRPGRRPARRRQGHAAAADLVAGSRRPRPLVGVTVGRQRDKPVELRRHGGDPVRGGGHRAVDVLVGDVDGGVAGERLVPGEHLEAAAARRRRRRCARRRCRARPARATGRRRCPAARRSGRSSWRCDGAGQAEVGDLDHPVVTQDDVLGLDVAVDQAGAVRGASACSTGSMISSAARGAQRPPWIRSRSVWPLTNSIARNIPPSSSPWS